MKMAKTIQIARSFKIIVASGVMISTTTKKVLFIFWYKRTSLNFGHSISTYKSYYPITMEEFEVICNIHVFEIS